MEPTNPTSTGSDRIDTGYYLPATPSETAVRALRRLAVGLDRFHRTDA